MTQYPLSAQPATASHNGQTASATPLSHSTPITKASAATSTKRRLTTTTPARLVHSQAASSTTPPVNRAKPSPVSPNRPTSISGASHAAVMTRCLSTRYLDLFVSQAEAALSAAKIIHCQVEGITVKIGP